MGILYCGIASKFIHTVPAGWFLCEYLKEKGIRTEEIYRNVNEPLSDIVNDIVARAPRFLLLSVYIFNVTFVQSLISYIRNLLPGCVIVAGGPEACESLDADHIIIGEGEEALYTLLQDGGQRLIYSKSIVNLDILPSPYTPQRLAASHNKMIYYESSRGCPFSCAYCMAGLSRGVRYFSLQRVKNDLVNIVASGAKIIKFTDRTFNANTKRTEDILSFILCNFSDNKDVCFHFEVGGDLFAKSTLELLSKMPDGLVQLEAGVQTLNTGSLKAVNRTFDADRFIYNIKRILSAKNIHLHLDLIAGLPHETLTSFIYSFNEVYALRPHMLQLGFLKFLKGTPIRNNTEACYSADPPYEVISTPTMSAKDLTQLKGVERMLDRLYNSGRFYYTLEYLLEYAPSSYELYLSLSQHMLLLTLKNEIDLFQGLISYKGGLPYIKEVLRLDYFIDTAIHKTPRVLKKERSASYRDFIKHRLIEAGCAYEDFVYLPKLGQGNYIVKFDYSVKNRVSGKFSYTVIT